MLWTRVAPVPPITGLYNFGLNDLCVLPPCWCLKFEFPSTQGAWDGTSSTEGSRFHGQQPGTPGAAEEDGSQSHPPERRQSAAGPARYTGSKTRAVEVNALIRR